jgi:hypothetical protein
MIPSPGAIIFFYSRSDKRRCGGILREARRNMASQAEPLLFRRSPPRTFRLLAAVRVGKRWSKTRKLLRPHSQRRRGRPRKSRRLLLRPLSSSRRRSDGFGLAIVPSVESVGSKEEGSPRSKGTTVKRGARRPGSSTSSAAAAPAARIHG